MFSVNNNLKDLGLEKEILTKLSNKNIITVKNLWGLKREALKDYDLTNEEINQIVIKLQLVGIDLNKKVYDKK
jgi:hypothetical protein